MAKDRLEIQHRHPLRHSVASAIVTDTSPFCHAYDTGPKVLSTA
jgi:hypothetical protein